MGGDGRESKAGEVMGRRERKKIIGKMQAIVHLPLPCLVCKYSHFCQQLLRLLAVANKAYQLTVVA